MSITNPSLVFSDRSFRWLDGSGYQYEKWAPGQPDGAATVDDCMVINVDSDDWPQSWKDQPCTNEYVKYGYVCKAEKGGTKLLIHVVICYEVETDPSSK